MGRKVRYSVFFFRPTLAPLQAAGSNYTRTDTAMVSSPARAILLVRCPRDGGAQSVARVRWPSRFPRPDRLGLASCAHIAHRRVTSASVRYYNDNLCDVR